MPFRMPLMPIAGAAFVFTLSACSGDVATPSATPAAPVNAQAEAGEIRIATRLDEALQAAAKNDRFYGAVLLENEGDVLLREAYGPVDEAGTPATPGARYNVGSIGKMFTQVLILNRVEDGVISLDDTLADLLPGEDLPNADAITVRQLLSHASGYGDYFRHPDYTLEQRTIEEFLDLVRTAEPRFPPGEGFAYSNSAFWVLARILEKTDPQGRGWREQFEEDVFDAAGMTGVREFQPDETYEDRPDGFEVKRSGEVEPVFDDPRPGPDGGFYMTVDDLQAFDEALGNHLWYGEDLYQESLRPLTHFDLLGGDIGLVWEITNADGTRYVTKSGTTTGGGATYARFSHEGEDYTLILLSNLSNAPAETYHQLMGYAFGVPGTPLPGRPPLVLIHEAVTAGDLAPLEADYAAWAHENGFRPDPLPPLVLASQYLGEGQQEEARRLLEITVDAFRDSETAKRLLDRVSPAEPSEEE